MFKLKFLLLAVIGVPAFAQQDSSILTKPIVEEGKRLYRSEMASWYGTDIFVEKYKDQANIGGYFSYTENDLSTCVFFSKTSTPKVIGTIVFDKKYNTKTAKTDLTEREFSSLENDLYSIRKIAYETIISDTLVRSYPNTKLNLVPLISNSEKKVYVLTGPEKAGVVIFGSDYLLTFDNNNNLVNKKAIHKNIIPINFRIKDDAAEDTEGTIHSHLPETGDFITATDICTLMLYENFTRWKQHNVVSANYLSIWNCLKDELTVIPMAIVDKINKEQEEHNKKKKQSE
jgi:hypothetical protein